MPHFKNIVGAEAIEAPTTSSLREGSSPIPKNLLKVSAFDRNIPSLIDKVKRSLIDKVKGKSHRKISNYKNKNSKKKTPVSHDHRSYERNLSYCV